MSFPLSGSARTGRVERRHPPPWMRQQRRGGRPSIAKTLATTSARRDFALRRFRSGRSCRPSLRARSQAATSMTDSCAILPMRCCLPRAERRGSDVVDRPGVAGRSRTSVRFSRSPLRSPRAVCSPLPCRIRTTGTPYTDAQVARLLAKIDPRDTIVAVSAITARLSRACELNARSVLYSRLFIP